MMDRVVIFVAGVFLGYFIKTVKYYTYNPPNLTHRYTYKEIMNFVGSKPILKRGVLCGSKNTAITIGPDVVRDDNTIHFRGSYHRSCSPADPGHQSIKYSVNKRLNEIRSPIYVFVKIRSNEYAFIGTGLRNGKYYKIQENSRDVFVFPIRYTSGNLNMIMKVLENEIESCSSGSGSD
jgi:uncharacterized protein YneF (UPF0154 family)